MTPGIFNAYQDALDWHALRSLLPTTLSSLQIQQLGGFLIRQSVFSARTDDARVVQRIADVTKSILNPVTATRADGTPYTEGINEATAKLMIKQVLDEINYQPTEEERGTIKDLSSWKRRSLVVQTIVQTAQGAGHYLQGTDPDVVEAYPCWELVRFEKRKQERDWHDRWRTAGRQVGDFDALRCLDQHGRMVARKDSEIWAALGDPDLFPDALGNPYPPFAFSSGMWCQDVSADESTKLGFDIQNVQPAPLDLSVDQSVPQEIKDARFQASILAGLGEGYQFKSSVLTNRFDSPPAIANRLLRVLDAFTGGYIGNTGTSDGAAKGWETRRAMGALIDSATSGKSNAKQIVSFGQVGAGEAATLKAATGLNLEGYTHAVDNYSILHIIKKHGDPARETPRGQVAVTKSDLQRIPEIISHPDKIESAGKTKTGLDSIRYTKHFADTTIIIEEVRTGKKQLVPITMMKFKKKN